MRIAYIAPYQGRDLIQRRPCVYNLSLAARVKIQLVAELLQRSGHDVQIISQGALEPQLGIDQLRLRFYRGFVESERFHPEIPVYYASALALKFVTGFWESAQTRRVLQARHKAAPFDAVILYNLQRGQVGCARYAMRRLGVPVLLQYEDDSFVNVHGQASEGLISKYHRKTCRQVLAAVSGGTGVSPYLLSQMPSGIPKLLLRGIVSDQVVRTRQQGKEPKKNWVVFSGTHEGTQGLEQMVNAWRLLRLADWELHIAGQGPLTATLEKLAEGDPTIVFHGLLNREQNARMICAAKIGLNPQDLTKTPGNVFPFKIVEYLAAGNHVITTPRGSLEPELEAGVTYIPDNAADTIAECLKRVISERRYERTAEQAALQTYGPAAMAESLNRLVLDVAARHGKERPMAQTAAPAPADAR